MTSRVRGLALCALSGLICIGPLLEAAAQDWPQILGPARNGVYAGPLARTLPKSGPALLWKRDVGAGLAGPAVVAGRLILFHRLGAREVVEAMDAATGKAIR